MDDRAFFCTGLALPSEDIDIACVTNKKNGKKNGEKGFRKKEARRRKKYVENWYYPTYYQAYVKMSNGDPHRMKPSLPRVDSGKSLLNSLKSWDRPWNFWSHRWNHRP